MTLHELSESLEDHLADPTMDAQLEAIQADPEAAESLRESFRIDTLAQADWAARKIERARRRLAEAREVAEAHRARIAEWEAEQVRRCEADTDFLASLLEGYHRRQLEADGKQTQELPCGAKLVLRKQPDQWRFDDANFVTWAQSAAPDLLRTKVEVDRAAAKKALTVTGDGGVVLTADGEVAPVQVVPGEVRFSIKTEADG